MFKPTGHFRPQFPLGAETKGEMSASDFESPLLAHLRQLRAAQDRALEEIERQKEAFICSASRMTRDEVIANIHRFHMHFHPDRQVVLLDGVAIVTFTMIQDEIQVEIQVEIHAREPRT